MYYYDTVSEAIEGLKHRGFTADFNISFDHLKCNTEDVRLYPEEFEIVEHYRFEGETNPSDEDVVYAIAERGGNLKGILVNAFGTYGDEISDELIQKLAIHEQ